jgi:hypothetical protein
MTEDERIDLLITFFEQERDYAGELLVTSNKTRTRFLNKRIQWFNTLVGTLKESKTDEGIRNLKEAIERERKRKAGTGVPV